MRALLFSRRPKNLFYTINFPGAPSSEKLRFKRSPDGWFRKKLQMQGAQKPRSEAHILVRRNDEVEAQRRRWTFYETITGSAWR